MLHKNGTVSTCENAYVVRESMHEFTYKFIKGFAVCVYTLVAIAGHLDYGLSRRISRSLEHSFWVWWTVHATKTTFCATKTTFCDCV